MKNKSLLFVIFLAVAAPYVAAQSAVPSTPPPAAAKGAVKGPAKPYPLKVCVVTDSDLDSMGDEVTFVYQGQTIKICCKPCEKKFLRAPEKYLAKLAALEAAKK
jgi:YHS domain-containing protein